MPVNTAIRALAVAVVGTCCFACSARATEPSLIPDTLSTAPDYFCTWNVQGFACSYSGASDQADMMTEASLFGKGPNQNWLEFYPEVRADLTRSANRKCSGCTQRCGNGRRKPRILPSPPTIIRPN